MACSDRSAIAIPLTSRPLATLPPASPSRVSAVGAIQWCTNGAPHPAVLCHAHRYAVAHTHNTSCDTGAHTLTTPPWDSGAHSHRNLLEHLCSTGTRSRSPLSEQKKQMEGKTLACLGE